MLNCTGRVRSGWSDGRALGRTGSNPVALGDGALGDGALGDGALGDRWLMDGPLVDGAAEGDEVTGVGGREIDATGRGGEERTTGGRRAAVFGGSRFPGILGARGIAGPLFAGALLRVRGRP